MFNKFKNLNANVWATWIVLFILGGVSAIQHKIPASQPVIDVSDQTMTWLTIAVGLVGTYLHPTKTPPNA